jgi:LPXTG-motif cell wall-anchored protein
MKRKLTENKHTNYRIWKKGKTWLYGSSLAAALVGGILFAGQTVNADISTDTPQVLTTETIEDSEVPAESSKLTTPASSDAAASESRSPVTFLSTSDTPETYKTPVTTMFSETKTEETENSESASTSSSSSSIPEENSISSSKETKEQSTSSTTQSASVDKTELTKAAAVTSNAVSADITLTVTNTTTELPDTPISVAAAGKYFIGATGTITVRTSDLQKGNTIVLADVTQTSTESSGALANLKGASQTDFSVNGVKYGTITYDAGKKAFVLSVSTTFTSDSDEYTFSIEAPTLMVINDATPVDIQAKMPFDNTISVSGNDYTFSFKAPIPTHPATNISGDKITMENDAYSSSSRNDILQGDIANNTVLNQLQASEGKAGDVLENKDIMTTVRLSSSQAIDKIGDSSLFFGIYYVSDGKIQASEGSTYANSGRHHGQTITTTSPGDFVTQTELQNYAKSHGTGVYYSKQTDGSYIFVNYVIPEDTVLTKEEIEWYVRNSPLAASKSSEQLDADVQATKDYYAGALGNRASFIQFYNQIKWLDPYSVNTLTTQQLDNDGNVIPGKELTRPTTPIGIASGQTPVVAHYITIDGKKEFGTSTKPGTPTGKENSLGGIVYGKASMTPLAEAPTGYTLVTSANLDSLSAAQKDQLLANLIDKGILSAGGTLDKLVMDNVDAKSIFGSKTDSVPFPGFADKLYDENGKIVTSGGIAGYGQTDVYYFYVPNSQKVVYNIFDDGLTADETPDDTSDDKLLDGPDKEFDNGYSLEPLNKAQEDLDKLLDQYINPETGKYDLVVETSDTVADGEAFDNDDDKDQVINIHLVHRIVKSTETKDVNETIHYQYEDGSEAAPDKTDSVTFTRDVEKDAVDGTYVTEGEWTAKDDDTSFDEKISPTIENYTPNKASIAEVTGLTDSSADVEKTVIYKADTEEVTDEKTVNQVIHYVYEDGTTAAPDSNDSVKFTRTGSKNLATGDITWDDWVAENEDTTFDAVTSPTIDGYTADKLVVDETTGLTADSDDIAVTVTYKKPAAPATPEEPENNTKPPVGNSAVQTPTPTPVVKSAESVQKGSILPSTGEQRTAMAVVGGFMFAAAGIIGLLIHLRRRKQ